jgi:HSP90 family molecular chaperone
MAVDYAAIRADNQRRYGTDIERIGPMLLANRYDDRTHFIYELLQNAEDALKKRKSWKGSRAVSFHLTESELRVEH